MLRSDEIGTIRVHHLCPGRHEVLYELLLCPRTGVDLGNGFELQVRPEDEINPRSGPIDCA